MLRLEETPSFREEIQRLASEVQGGPERAALNYPEAQGRGRLVRGIAQAMEGAVTVSVRPSLDQAERALLELAGALGAGWTERVDAALRSEPDAPEQTLGLLDDGLGQRPLIVEGIEHLGAFTSDPEIGNALQERTRSVRRWLFSRARLVVGYGLPLRGRALRRPVLEAPPLALVNGMAQDAGVIWNALAPDLNSFELVLVEAALREEAAPESLLEEGVSVSAVRGRILAHLPTDAERLLKLLALHEGPLSDGLLASLGLDAASLATLGRLPGPWRRERGEWSLGGDWSRWFQLQLPERDRAGLHHQLARAFAAEVRPEDPAAGRAATSILEAHRHFAAAGLVDQAARYARYGATLLVEGARQLSMQREYGAAARLYALVVDAAEGGQIPTGSRLRAYARHYLHFNRAHAEPELEPIEATTAGYRRSLEDWEGNALFWSRLVRSTFYQGRSEEALGLLRQAMAVVEDHPEKENVLIARTTRGLLQQDRLEDALRVWDGFKPRGGTAEGVEDRLAARLERGWVTARITLGAGAQGPLVFTRPLEIRVERIQGRQGTRWLASLPALEATVRGDSPLAAVQALADVLRQEARALLRAFSHQLDERELSRKALVLGAVDVIASEVEAPGGESAWVFGELVRREDDSLWLHSAGNFDAWFVVPEAVAEGVTVGELPRLALVRCEPPGVPQGPVLKLGDPFRGSEDDLWEAWRRRLQDAS